ncbi:MAG: hypothetical protein QNJ98_00240 [Planctomycetota bacterium]|nr:hypothetical protein [Planctomycetota bacterium]
MRPELRWLVMTILIVGVLLAISALALDRPNVIWSTDGPACPACRSEVAFHANKCQGCATDFDWTIAPDDVSPISNHSLSRLEADELREHIERIGEDAAAQLIARKLEIPEERAKAYLESLARGRCGFCGGTGDDLGSTQETKDCPVCFGDENCIASGGTGHSTWGDEAAARAFGRLEQEIRALSPRLPKPMRASELERLVRAFLADHLGTTQAARLPFWQDLIHAEASENTPRRAADVGRARLDLVMTFLRNADGP